MEDCGCRKCDGIAEELFDSGSDPGFELLHPGFEFLAKDGWLKSVADVLIRFAQARLSELKEENGETAHVRHIHSCASRNSFLSCFDFGLASPSEPPRHACVLPG